MENANVANNLNKYYFLATWTDNRTATSDYILKKIVRLTYMRGAIWDLNLLQVQPTP